MVAAVRRAGGHRARAALVVVDAFAAVTAIGGGLALVAELEGDRFPSTWLAAAPVSPTEVLLVARGGFESRSEG